MQLARSAIVANSRRFGRGPVRYLRAPEQTGPVLSDDIKLFAATFLAGFLFVSILIG